MVFKIGDPGHFRPIQRGIADANALMRENLQRYEIATWTGHNAFAAVIFIRAGLACYCPPCKWRNEKVNSVSHLCIIGFTKNGHASCGWIWHSRNLLVEFAKQAFAFARSHAYLIAEVEKGRDGMAMFDRFEGTPLRYR